MYKLDRKAIRKVLKDYLKAEEEFKIMHNQILNDNEIQSLYEKEMIMEARKLTREKYSNYSFLKNQLYNSGIKLIQVMIDGIPDFKGIQPEEIYRNNKRFEELVNLARLV